MFGHECAAHQEAKDAGAAQLAGVLALNKTLERLDLQHNGITEARHSLVPIYRCLVLLPRRVTHHEAVFHDASLWSCLFACALLARASGPRAREAGMAGKKGGVCV